MPRLPGWRVPLAAAAGHGGLSSGHGEEGRRLAHPDASGTPAALAAAAGGLLFGGGSWLVANCRRARTGCG